MLSTLLPTLNFVIKFKSRVLFCRIFCLGSMRQSMVFEMESLLCADRRTASKMRGTDERMFMLQLTA